VAVNPTVIFKAVAVQTYGPTEDTNIIRRRGWNVEMPMYGRQNVCMWKEIVIDNSTLILDLII
jgi:hypothetical protein